MNIWRISIQNIKSKALYTLLSILTLSLSIGLLLGIQQLKTSFEHQAENNLGNIDLVIGAKGSPLQLVLSSVLHIDNPTGNISYKEAKKLSKHRLVKTAIPISYGDNFKGYRIVGTTHDFLRIYDAELEKGKQVHHSLEAVIGNSVAEQLQLSLGDTFTSSHGLIENDIDVHEERFTVVGILKPTQKVIDRLIVTNLESIWDVHHHEEHEDEHSEHHHEEHSEAHHDLDEEKEITSLLISFKNPFALLNFPRKINKSTNMQAAIPKYELERLYEFTGVGLNTIAIIAYLILIISGLTIFISLYKMVKERAFDLALLRTYGASNLQLIQMVFYEGFLIILIAFAFGFVLEQIGINYIVQLLASGKQQNIITDLPLLEVIKIGGLVLVINLLSIFIAVFPIVKMNISTILSNEK